MLRARANGFTVIDLAATLAAGTVLLTAAMPLTASIAANDARQESRLHLATLNQIHTMYAVDHEGRQYSHLPDDFTGNATQYQLQHGCIDPLVLGTDVDGNTWGYYLSCGGYGGSNGNITSYLPIDFNSTQVNGMFRNANARKLNEYANGRFFDPLFFAADDPSLQESDIKRMRSGVDFGLEFPSYHFAMTSYTMSPAAMWAPRVMGAGQRMKNASFIAPSGPMQDYRCPRVNQCLYPSLKTRLMELYAMNNAPAPCNPAYGDCTPYMWNQSAATRNLALFYDGSVAEFGVQETLIAEDAVGANFWLRNTPFGAGGVGGNAAAGGVTSSAHFLTTFGILGRDRISP